MLLLPLSVNEASCIAEGKNPNCAAFAKPTAVGKLEEANSCAERPLLDGYRQGIKKKTFYFIACVCIITIIIIDGNMFIFMK